MSFLWNFSKYYVLLSSLNNTCFWDDIHSNSAFNLELFMFLITRK